MRTIYDLLKQYLTEEEVEALIFIVNRCKWYGAEPPKVGLRKLKEEDPQIYRALEKVKVDLLSQFRKDFQDGKIDEIPKDVLENLKEFIKEYLEGKPPPPEKPMTYDKLVAQYKEILGRGNYKEYEEFRERFKDDDVRNLILDDLDKKFGSSRMEE
jgi:hypothetical protein